MFRFFPTFHETPDGTQTAGAQPPEAPEAPPAAPWTSDLETAFAGLPEEVRADAIRAADGYMRERVQPRITKLEQDSAPALKLYNDLTSPDTVDRAVATIVHQVYGGDVSEKFIAMFGEDGEDIPEGTTPAEAVEAAKDAAEAEAEGAPADDPRLAWVEEKQAAEQREADQREYEEFLDEVIAEPEFGLTAADRELLHPFMASSETVGEAVTKYKAYVAQVRGEQPEPPPPADPPPTLGSQGAPAATPPTQQKYGWDDLEQAAADFAKEQRAKKAPATL